MKKSIIVKAVLALIAGVAVIFGAITISKTQQEFYFPHAQMLTQKSFKDTQKANEQVYVLYKPTCKKCKEQMPNIKAAMHELAGDTGINVQYINTKDGVPDWFIDAFPANTFAGIKTPYLIYVNKDNKNQAVKDAYVYGKRLDTHQAIKDMIKNINEAHKPTQPRRPQFQSGEESTNSAGK